MNKIKTIIINAYLQEEEVDIIRFFAKQQKLDLLAILKPSINLETKIRLEKPELLFFVAPELTIENTAFLDKLSRDCIEVAFITKKILDISLIYKYAPVDLLMPPIRSGLIAKTIEKVQATKRGKQSKNLVPSVAPLNEDDYLIRIPFSQGAKFINIENIIRFEAQGVYTKIYLNIEKQIISSSNIGKYDAIIRNKPTSMSEKFFRIHAKHLVNLSYITEYNKTISALHLKDGSLLKIAQRRVQSFNRIELNI